MPTVAEVKLWGRTIGAVALAEGEAVADFQYAPAFAGSGIEPAPLVMPLRTQVYRFPELARESFHGLPGMLADSLPDKYGNVLIDAWLARQGRTAASFNVVERLCYIGARGMGALEFAPALGPKAKESHAVDVAELVALASEILTHRGTLAGSLESAEREQTLRDILQVGTSAGGARAKALIAWHPATNEVRSGQIDVGAGFEYWLMKFDGVAGNKDKDLDDPSGYGVIEYAYSQMARAAGIAMRPTRLLEENGRRHFMTRRFDRLPGGRKLHMQSLAGLCHYDFNLAGAYSYEQAMLAMRQLDLPMTQVEALFRRMTFNIVARNQDDHVKNIAFLMDKAGTWSLAPAFDVTYSYNPRGKWTSAHQMSLNGKRDRFTSDDFEACAKAVSMKRGRSKTILEEVKLAVSAWRDHADEAGVDAVHRDTIQGNLRLAIG